MKLSFPAGQHFKISENDLQNGISVICEFRDVLCGICSGFEADRRDETFVHQSWSLWQRPQQER